VPLTNIPSTEFDTLQTQNQPNSLNATKAFKTIIQLTTKENLRILKCRACFWEKRTNRYLLHCYTSFPRTNTQMYQNNAHWSAAIHWTKNSVVTYTVFEVLNRRHANEIAYLNFLSKISFKRSIINFF